MSTILLIEDSDRQRTEIRKALEESELFDRILEADNGVTGLQRLLSEPVDLVLCDLVMPLLDGEKLVRANAERDDGALVPVIVLTSVTDAARRARLLRRGAADVIGKPFQPEDLIARIALNLKLVTAQKELIEKNRELERLSSTDPLTGLPNRRFLDQTLAAEFNRSRRHQLSFAVVMIDIDHFKRVNDQFGHLVGDEVLRRVAGVIGERVRATDCGGRYGGEEFLAVLTNNDAPGALIFAERLRAAVEELQIDSGQGQSVSVTLSIGVAAWNPHIPDFETVIAAADRALYEAKARGRNQVVVASELESL
ncbi:MAG: diguanylate cyclase [Myxococcota bacterium]